MLTACIQVDAFGICAQSVARGRGIAAGKLDSDDVPRGKRLDNPKREGDAMALRDVMRVLRVALKLLRMGDVVSGDADRIEVGEEMSLCEEGGVELGLAGKDVVNREVVFHVGVV